MEHKRVVVTGLGALTPIGNNVDEYWTNLVAGRSGAGPITYFDASKFKTQFACELKGFDAQAHFDRKELRIYDPFVLYALVASDEAVADAGLSDRYDPTRIGVIWGSGNGGIKTFHDGVRSFSQGDGTPQYNPYFMPKMLVNMASGIISMRFGFKGISLCPVTACASSNTALIEAYHHIRWGNADVVVAGGSDAPINETGIGGFNALRALSTKNECPEGASRPFDVERDGFVMGEGAGAIILESYEHAQKRGAKIYAELAGGCMTSDAYHLTSTHPEGEGAIRAMTLSMERAHVGIEEVDHINCHATSTPVGDISELRGITTIFHEHKPIVTATKSTTGHLLGAAGAIEAIAAIRSIADQTIPPTINTRQVDPETPEGFDIVLNEARKTEVNVVMSNTFGFGGHNATVLFRKFPA